MIDFILKRYSAKARFFKTAERMISLTPLGPLLLTSALASIKSCAIAFISLPCRVEYDACTINGLWPFMFRNESNRLEVLITTDVCTYSYILAYLHLRERSKLTSAPYLISRAIYIRGVWVFLSRVLNSERQKGAFFLHMGSKS